MSSSFRFSANSEFCPGQKSAQGLLCLRNRPNSGPNSVKRILDARISDPNSWVEFFDSVFSSERGPLKNSPSRNSPPKIHLPKFNPEIGPKNSHCTPARPFSGEKKKTNKHKQLRGIVPEMGGGQIVCVFPLFLRKRGNTQTKFPGNLRKRPGESQDSPGKIPGQSRENLVYVSS